jgi:CDP-paratose 2-epimerase
VTHLVTGGCGFVGSHLVARLLAEGAEVVVLDDLSRAASAANLEWLRSRGALTFVKADVRDAAAVSEIVSLHRPRVLFHLAGQVAMTTSLEDPRRDFETNAFGTFNVLDALRLRSPDTALVYASSNKVYGALATLRLREEELRYTVPDQPHGIDESAPLDFQTPYGCSKGAADQYVLDAARVFGLKTVVFRHSTIYGGRQRATFDQGWVGWFCAQALAQKRDRDRRPFTIAGDGKQVRDLLYVDDAVEAYLAAAFRIDAVCGEAMNIGGGVENSSSLLELFATLGALADVHLRFERLDWRVSDQRFFVADCRKANRLLGWKPRIAKNEGVRRTLAEVSAWLESAGDAS